MAVNPNKIDLATALKKAAEKNNVVVQQDNNVVDKPKIDLSTALKQAAENLKKKETPQSVTTPNALPTGAVNRTYEFSLPFGDPTKIQQTPEQKEEANYKGFKETDKQSLSTLLNKHGVSADPLEKIRSNLGITVFTEPKPAVSMRPFAKEYGEVVDLENNLKSKIQTEKDKFKGLSVSPSEGFKIRKQIDELNEDLQNVKNLKNKAARELTIEGADEVKAVVGTDQSGNNLNKLLNRLGQANAITAPLAAANISLEVQDEIKKLPTQFTTGLRYIEKAEPVEYARVLDALKNGNRLSATQVAAITNYGIDIEEERLNRDVALAVKNTKPDTDRLTNMKGQMDALKPAIESYEEKVKQLQLSPQEIADYKNKVNEYNTLVKEAKPLQQKLSDAMGGYAAKAEALSKTKLSNLLDNEEVLRAFLSEGIAERGDEIGKATQAGNVVSPQAQVAGFMLGHTWNYSDDEIKNYGERTAKENGLDPTSPQVQKAIKYLQDNEGIMVMQNSIAKAGGIREFFKGAAEPIRGISNTLEDLGKESYKVYAEGKSQGNVNVSEKRLKAEDTGVRGVLNEVLKGTGQFATQAGLMYATGAGIGGVARGILGRAGTAALQGDIALADMGLKDIVGKALLKGQNPIATFTTSYAMAYDGNLKNALSYTSDNSLAKKAAAFNSGLEGATELFLSPLDIATGIAKKFTKGQTQDLLKILSDKSLKSDPSKLKEYATKFVKGVLGTAKVAGAEIGEEIVTQIADYATNAYLNPDSESFQNRDLQKELMHTAYQTGITMAIPALLNGIGSAKANTFSKGSLMIAAQNRQQMIDSYKKSFEAGSIDQNQLNANISLINTAAQANAELPTKADGTVLNTNEKADYIFSRVTEAMLQNKANRVKDAAEKQILNKQIIQQQNYRAAILGNEKIAEEPSYKVDGNEVSKADFIRIAKSENSNDYNFEVTGDEETQKFLRSIGGIDTENNAIAADGKEDANNEKNELLDKLSGNEILKNIEGTGAEKIKYLQEQAISAPESFARKINDEAAHVELIAKNKVEDIEAAIEYQQKRLSEDNADIEVIDAGIQVLEKGLEKAKELSSKKESIPVSETPTQESSTRVEEGSGGGGGEKKTNTVNGYEFTKTPTLDNVVVEPIPKDNMPSIEEQLFVGGSNNVLQKGVSYEGGGWYKFGEDNFGGVHLYNTVTKEGVTLNHKQGGRTGVVLHDFIKNNSRYNDNIAVRGSKFTEAEHNPKFGGSGHYKGTYFYVGLSAESKALEHGKNLTKVDIENANLYELGEDGQTSQSLKNEAKKAGYDTRDASGYAESEYLKKQGYDGIKRGNEIVLFEPKKFEVKAVEQSLKEQPKAENKPLNEATQEPIKADEPVPTEKISELKRQPDKEGGKAKGKLAKFKEKHIKKDDSTKSAKSVDESVPKNDTEPKGQTDKEPVQQSADDAGQGNAVDATPVLNEAQTIEAEKKQKIEQLTAEKQQKINEVTKPEINFDTGLSLTDLAGTNEANRQLHDDYKSQLASLKNIVNCLWQ